jgi:hypothetical protein
MTPSIFYSWQSDLPEKGNRYFIRDTLSKVQRGLTVENSLRIESATDGVSGTPDIAATIYEKIEEAEIAVFDVTPVGRVASSHVAVKWMPEIVQKLLRKSDARGKTLPNPNVLIELGFAAEAIGWERIVCVMNKGYGHNPEELPFHLRGRRFPICYVHSGNAKPSEAIASDVKHELERAIVSCLEHLHKRVTKTLRLMNQQCLTLLNQFGMQDSFVIQNGNLQPGVDRLLDLEVTWCHFDPKTTNYAYHWTHLGKRVREALSRQGN